ncbi:insulinase family protein [Patescibacteria group bacterium]|nr:insulinase family protein [Patescibacteria group bacterium]MBU2259138.1 insulinase family protein [Patescibacteria group bacterium]
MHSVKKLDSGLRILTAPSNGTASITVLVFAGAGSRYEEEKERGISHFLEHMFFKGGKKYKSTREVSVAIDGVGGEFNAFTGKEYAGYYVKVASQHIDLGCDVLSDMLINARFPQEDIERERGVIMEEERMYHDTPMYRAGWDFETLIFGDNPLGWDTIGKEKVIKSVQQADFQAHKDLLYTPDNLVVAFAGKVSEGEAMGLSEKYFAGIEGSKKREFKPFKFYGNDRVSLRTKKTEQAHLVLGVPGINSLDDDYFTQKLLAIILGGNMSSRMFLNIREAKGLCYYISTEDDAYLDAGSLSTRAGVDQSRLYDAIRLIKHEYLECASEGVTDEELKRAKDFLKGKITLSLEDSEERAHFYGKQELMYPKVRTVEDYFSELDAVSKEKVDALAARLLKPEEMRLVVIGKEEDKENLEKVIR